MEPLSDKVAAIEVGQTSVKAVVMGVDRGMPVLKRAAEAKVAQPGDQGEGNPLYEACREALGTLDDELVVSTVDAPDVLVRQLHIEVAKDKEIDQALPFQIEPLLPFPVEEAIVDYVVLERDKQGAQLAVLSIPSDRLQVHMERMQAGGVEPERTSCVPAALATLLYRLLPSEEAHGILHFGVEATSCVVVRQGKVLANRAIAFGADHLAGADGVGVDFQNFDPASALGLHQRAERWRAEVTRAFYALTARENGGVVVPQIFLAGDFGRFRNLDVYLSQALEIPLTQLPVDSPFCSPLGDVTTYAVPLGLALGALPLRTPRIDFRKGSFAYPRPWRRWQKRLIAYFGICVALAGAVLLLGRTLRKEHRAVLQQEYVALLNCAAQTFEEPIELPPRIDTEEIVKSAKVLGSRFDALPETFPLAPGVPRLSDVLAWIATHPKLLTTDPKSGERRAAVTLDNLQYVMVKHPTLKAPKEKYRVRVDLEFIADSPTVARELHKALLEPNDFIDPSSEVTWTQSRGSYRTSFYLRDNTYYPSG